MSGQRPPGRPRSEAARRAVLDAALEELQERPYAEVSVASIAARAGTGKQTIYRWWSSKADVVLDAVLDLAQSRIQIPDTGSLEDDLASFLRATFRQRDRRPALVGLMAESVLDPEFGEQLRTRFLAQRRDALRTILERAAARGEVDEPKRRIDLLIDVVFGFLWYRLLVESGPLSPAAARGLTDVVVRAAR